MVSMLDIFYVIETVWLIVSELSHIRPTVFFNHLCKINY